MLSVRKCTIKESIHQSERGFNYPKLINIYPFDNPNENTINMVNEEMLQDVMIFKETVEYEADSDNRAYTDYKIGFKKRNIISLAIEFFELFKSHNITYINTYNYDISKNKRLELKDIFKENIDYSKIINREVEFSINKLLNQDKYYSLDFDDIDFYMQIDEEQIFYLKSDRLVICFSSYELGTVFDKPIEIEIKFEKYKKYLSNYILDEIWEVHKD